MPPQHTLCILVLNAARAAKLRLNVPQVSPSAARSAGFTSLQFALRRHAKAMSAHQWGSSFRHAAGKVCNRRACCSLPWMLTNVPSPNPQQPFAAGIGTGAPQSAFADLLPGKPPAGKLHPGKGDEGGQGLREVLTVLGETPVAFEPAERALDHPAAPLLLTIKDQFLASRSDAQPIQAAALGRAETVSCQRRRWLQPWGTARLIRAAKLTVTSAMMSAIV
jgi:hypothetical protein